MLPKHKQPSLEAGLLIILVVISVFSIGHYSGEGITGVASADITGNVKVTGMATKEVAEETIKVTGMATTEEVEKANEKALKLYDEMRGVTDPDEIFTTLESIEGKKEMELVESSFKAMTEGETLDDWLKGEFLLSSHKKTRALYLVEWAKSDKRQRGVEKAGDLIDTIDTRYIGTKKKELYNILKGVNSKQEMEDIETAFESMTKETLEKWIRGDMRGEDRAEALGYIYLAKQKTENDVDYLKEYNYNYLELKSNQDGSYSREGYEGKYYIQKDGTVFYKGGKNPDGKDEPPQTFTKEGNWDTNKKEPIQPLETLLKPQPTIDKVGAYFVVKKADGTEAYNGKDADKAYEAYQKLKGIVPAIKGEPSIEKLDDGTWVVKDANGNQVHEGTDPDAAFKKLSDLTKEAILKPTAPTVGFSYEPSKAETTEVKDIGKIKLTIKGDEAIDKWDNVYKKVGDRWEIAKTGTEPKAPSLKGFTDPEINEFLTRMSIYSEQLKQYGADQQTQKEVKEHINLVKSKAKEYSNKPTEENKKKFEAAVQKMNDKLIEVKAQGASPTEQIFNLLYGNDIEISVAKDYFKKNADDAEIMRKLATEVYDEYEEEVMSNLIIEIALEEGKDSEAYNQAKQWQKDLIDFHLPKKQLADDLRQKGGKDIYYNHEKKEFHTKDGRIITKDSIKGQGTDWKSYTFEVSDILIDKVEKTGAERYFPEDIINDLREYARGNGIILDESKLAEGKIVDTLGNSYSWGMNFENKAVVHLDSKTPPSEIELNGRTQKLTKMEDYQAEGDRVLYKAEDGTIFSIDTDWSDAENQAYNGKISKIDIIGDKKEPNHIKIRNWFEVENGKKKSNIASVSIIKKDDPKIENDIPIDKETLSLIKRNIGAKGTISSTKDATGATIRFTNKDGQETSRITFSPIPGSTDYSITADKLTGIKSQTDFRYTLDTDQDGKISEEEKDAEEYVSLTTRFIATEEDDGDVQKVWYADDFRFGGDDIYFADMYMQEYEWNPKTERMEPTEDLIYYYIEGSKKGDEKAGKIDIRMNDKGEPITDGEGKIVKVEDGEVKGYNPRTGKYDILDIEDIGLDERALKRASQAASRKWFANLEFKLTQYKGLSGWSQLFWKEEAAKWRERVDKWFSSFYLGTDYWVSGICSKYIPKEQRGTLTMQTKDGLFDVIAHVEGERSSTINPNSTAEYLYKLTFSVRNPKNSVYDKLKFNVYLYGDRTVRLYEQDIEVDEDSSFTRGSGIRKDGKTTYDDQHGKPLVQYSSYNYNQICIKFSHSITNAEGGKEDEVCNAIVQYLGSPTKYKKKIIGTTGYGTPITALQTEPYREADF